MTYVLHSKTYVARQDIATFRRTVHKFFAPRERSRGVGTVRRRAGPRPVDASVTEYPQVLAVKPRRRLPLLPHSGATVIDSVDLAKIFIDYRQRACSADTPGMKSKGLL